MLTVKLVCPEERAAVVADVLPPPPVLELVHNCGGVQDWLPLLYEPGGPTPGLISGPGSLSDTRLSRMGARILGDSTSMWPPPAAGSTH